MIDTITFGLCSIIVITIAGCISLYHALDEIKYELRRLRLDTEEIRYEIHRLNKNLKTYKDTILLDTLNQISKEDK